MERGPFCVIDKFPMPANKEPTLQDLLNEEATLCNTGHRDSEERKAIHTMIRLQRTDRPPCFGEDDCSTFMLSRCAWRMDCGT